MATLGEIKDADKREEGRVSRLMKENKDLYEHEEKISNALSGELFPGHDKDTYAGCAAIAKDGVVLEFASGERNAGAVVASFSHVVVAEQTISGEKIPELTLDKFPKRGNSDNP